VTTDGLPVATKRRSISTVRSRIPLVLAGLLIIALIATIGLAAFTPGSSDGAPESSAVETLDIDLPISGRVASAVLALAVAPVRDADLATSTTLAIADPVPDTAVPEAAAESTTVAPDPTTSSSTTQPETTTTTAEPATAETASADTTPPALQVLSPKDGATVTNRVVEFSGVTERGASVASGPYDADTDGDGDWVLNLVLAPGANGATFTARDAAGNETTVRIVVNYDPPQSTTTTTKAPSPTTKPPSGATTTTTKAPSTTTTTEAPSSGYSPQWPADSGGSRNVESWRADVARHWDADKVECVLGLIKLESGGNPTASNGGRYLGLLQHSANYWASRAKGAGFVDDAGLVASPFNGEANIAAGAYLANYYERIGKDWRTPWTVWRSVPACGG
jgi:hypothetical protein